MTILRDTITKARELIAKPDGWIKNSALGKRRAGGGIHYTTLWQPGYPIEQANCFCTTGAVHVAARVHIRKEYPELPEHHIAALELEALETLYRQLSNPFSFDPAQSLMTFNDSLSTSHSDVLGIFDKAIAKTS